MNELKMIMPDCAILGLGYLGRPLAIKLYEKGHDVVAIKCNLTSDDINIPVQLDIIDLNQPNVFKMDLWKNWTERSTWICLLPPSVLLNYATTIKQWLLLAEEKNIHHIVYTSSTSVYGEEPRECNERSCPQPQSTSAKQILAVEKLLLESQIPNISILRLGGLYSSERHPLTKLLEKNNIQGGNKPVNIIHRDLAIDAIIQAIYVPNGKQIHNIVEKNHITRAEFYRQQAQILGLPLPHFDENDKSKGKIVKSIFDEELNL